VLGFFERLRTWLNFNNCIRRRHINVAAFGIALLAVLITNQAEGQDAAKWEASDKLRNEFNLRFERAEIPEALKLLEHAKEKFPWALYSLSQLHSLPFLMDVFDPSMVEDYQREIWNRDRDCIQFGCTHYSVLGAFQRFRMGFLGLHKVVMPEKAKRTIKTFINIDPLPSLGLTSRLYYHLKDRVRLAADVRPTKMQERVAKRHRDLADVMYVMVSVARENAPALTEYVRNIEGKPPKGRAIFLGSLSKLTNHYIDARANSDKDDDDVTEMWESIDLNDSVIMTNHALSPSAGQTIEETLQNMLKFYLDSVRYYLQDRYVHHIDYDYPTVICIMELASFDSIKPASPLFQKCLNFYRS
jgi:hypothetical protein